MSAKTMSRAIGLMSGTSMDGIDVALIETDGEHRVVRGPSRTYGYGSTLRTSLVKGLRDAGSIVERDERPGSLETLERDLTDRHADALKTFISEFNIDRTRVDLVAFHGQTVLHRPERGLTVQIGDGKRLAHMSGLPVVYDLRAADMVAGGQGAPLVPAYHAALAANLPSDLRAGGPIAFVNIGGISNVTWLDTDVDPIAFDSGPGNALLDQWVEREAGITFDQDGSIATEGGLLPDLAKAYLSADFFERKAPKSLDRSDFAIPETDAGSLEDVARTLCYVAARAILVSADRMPKPPRLWIISGGGRRHPMIMQDLREGAALEGADVMSAEEAGFDGDSMEAEAWAYLGVRSRRQLPLTWPTTTGASKPTCGGLFVLPD